MFYFLKILPILGVTIQNNGYYKAKTNTLIDLKVFPGSRLAFYGVFESIQETGTLYAGLVAL